MSIFYYNEEYLNLLCQYQKSIIKRNQIWKHFKGNKYKIYGIAKEKELNLRFILYYPIKEDLNYELISSGDNVIHTEKLIRLMIGYENINNVANSLIINRYSYKRYNNQEIEDLKMIGSQLIWARPYDDFFEIIPHIHGQITKFQLYKL